MVPIRAICSPEALPRRPHPPRPRRRHTRDDLRRWRLGPARRPADPLSGPGPPLLSAQYPQCPRQGTRHPQPAVKADLHSVMKTKTVPQARSAAHRFVDRWQDEYPKAVRCLRDDLDELLTYWRYKSLAERSACTQPMPSNAASARCAAVPDPWASSQMEPPWIVSSSLSSTAKIVTRASAPLSC
jgi:Transposase, Mutator family